MSVGLVPKEVVMLHAVLPSPNRTRRRMLLASAVGSAGALMAACVPGTGGQPPASTRPVTVEIWHPWAGTSEPLFLKIVADFHQLYPHVTVNAVIVTADVRQQKYVAAMAGGTAPAIAYPERQDFVPLVVL